MNTTAYKIASLVSAAGGRVYFVGGYVRDILLGIENKDIDIEVHGIAPEVLPEILKEVGKPVSIGKSFGIYSLEGTGIDIAMPRKEKNTGRGHKAFEIFINPFIGTLEAARRRDFTINSMMQDVLTGEIIDHFNGHSDLEKGIIRHVDDSSFCEDPLRVLRAAQFASRFKFEIAEDTKELCRLIDLSELSKERVEGELKKALLKGKKPSLFFDILRNTNQLADWFPEVRQLAGIEQNPLFHPEGDVYMHTMQVLDRACGFRSNVKVPYSFMLFALTHDFGKITTTEVINGAIHAYSHETAGVSIAEKFLKRITCEKAVLAYVRNMIPLHMRPNMIAFSKSPVKKSNHMFDLACAPADLVYFSMCDRPVFAGDTKFEGDSEFLFERLRIFEETMSRPFVSGSDLIAAGLNPGPLFSKALAYSHKLRLAGIEKEDALKQTLAFARKIK
ncbi:MAG: tRNA nucleotidyltransferase [Clostridia bacterium]|nr:tRNA nucleotidyltransferase [Clostridia bacterium]